MEQRYRLTALALLLVVIFSTLVYGVEGMEAMAESADRKSSAGQFEKRVATVSNSEPELLAFTEGGFSAGTHRIAPNLSLIEEEEEDEEEDEDDDDADADADADSEDDDADSDRDDEDDNDDSTDNGADDGPDTLTPDADGNSELEAGLYTTTFEAEDCRYQLISNGDIAFDYLYEPDPDDPEDYSGSRVRNNDSEARTIGEDHLHRGRMLVSINGIEPDTFTSSAGCGPWMPWSPVRRPLTRIADGDYWKGDIVEGEYTVPPGCFWEKVAAFRGGRLEDVIDGDIGPGSVMVDSGTYGLRIRKCQGQSLTRIGDAPPHVPYTHPGPGKELTFRESSR